MPVTPTLSGTTRDAAAAITALFTSYGLGSLAPKILEFLIGGYSADTVTILLQETPEYKQRFAANDARIKAGLSVLSPAEYLATERSYGQILKKYGLPAGFYDSTSDFKSFIEKDISPVELDQRASSASEFINRNDPQTLAYFKQYYTTGDMVAFALDPTRAAPLVGKAFQASEIGGAAAANQVSINQLTAESLASNGITTAQAQQGFGLVGQDVGRASTLSDIYGGEPLTASDLIEATFNNTADAVMKKNKLASQERAAFGGSGGAGATSLSKSDSGF